MFRLFQGPRVFLKTISLTKTFVVKCQLENLKKIYLAFCAKMTKLRMKKWSFSSFSKTYNISQIFSFENVFNKCCQLENLKNNACGVLRQMDNKTECFVINDVKKQQIDFFVFQKP